MCSVYGGDGFFVFNFLPAFGGFESAPSPAAASAGAGAGAGADAWLELELFFLCSL